MDCRKINLEEYYIQCPRDTIKWFPVYKLRAFQKDPMGCCIWIRPTDAIEWCQHNSLYFSNEVIGIYDPSNVYYDSLIRIEFKNSFDALIIKPGLCFSFLNQFELGIENEEVIKGIKYIAKTIKH